VGKGGGPIFANFAHEDWVLLGLRAELHMLIHSFRMDANDVDTPSFHEMHLPTYYTTYFKKQLNLKSMGISTNSELIEFVKDTVRINSRTNIFEAILPEDLSFDQLVKLTEDCRRDRQDAIDTGDASAELKFARVTQQPSQAPQQPTQSQQFAQQQQGGKASRGTPAPAPGKGGAPQHGAPPRPGKGAPQPSGYGAPRYSYGGKGTQPPVRPYGGPPQSGYGGGAYGGGVPVGMKRPYHGPTSGYDPNKMPRTGGSAPYGHSIGGGYGRR